MHPKAPILSTLLLPVISVLMLFTVLSHFLALFL